LDHKAEYKPQL
jgi:hypothetical protein